MIQSYWSLIQYTNNHASKTPQLISKIAQKKSCSATILASTRPADNAMTPYPLAPTSCFSHCLPVTPTASNESNRKIPINCIISVLVSKTESIAIIGTMLKKIVHLLTNQVSTKIPQMIVTQAIRISAPTGLRKGKLLQRNRV